MTMSPLEADYFEWLCNIVCSVKQKEQYEKLLVRLFNEPFRYILDMDANRASDGMELRYRFGREHRIKLPVIVHILDDKSCSVLEMLIALSLRVEENIMNDPTIGNCTDKWFWLMIENLGLVKMTDEYYDDEYVGFSLNIFMERRYESNGEGGLVVLKYPRQDLRFVEIWYQVMWYLSENYI